MSETIIKTDKPQQPVSISFETIGQTVSGSYRGSNTHEHIFLNGEQGFAIDNVPFHKTINEALLMVEDGATIKIEFLGEHPTEKRGMFEVSKID